MVVTRLTRNQLAGQTARGFESLHLRQKENPIDDCRQDFPFVSFIFHYSLFIRQDFQLIMKDEIASLMNNE